MKRTTIASVAALCALPMIAQPALAQTSSGTGTTSETGAAETDSSTYGVDAQAGGATTGPDATASGGSGATSSESGSDAMSSGDASGAGGTSTDTSDTGSMAGSDSGASSDGSASGSGGSSPDMSAGTGAGDQAQSGEAGESDADPLIVTVGGEEIKASDVRDAIAMLPPQIRQNAPDMLVPFAVEQLVMRELVLQRAAQENLSEDEEVTALAGSDDPAALENATVQIYVQRQMEGVASDEAVQAAYEDLSANSDTPLPPLADLRPQIEQQLQQQKLIEVRDDLKEEFEVVYYGPDGQPREASTDAGSGTGEGSGTGGAGMSGSGDTGASTGSASGGDSGTGTGSNAGTGAGTDATSGTGTEPDSTAGTGAGPDATSGTGTGTGTGTEPDSPDTGN